MAHKQAVFLIAMIFGMLHMPVVRGFNPSIFTFPWKSDRSIDSSRPKIRIPTDNTQLGSLTVPAIGIGTIAWDNDSGVVFLAVKNNWIVQVTESFAGNRELQDLVSFANENNCAFFDTAERYGGRFLGRQSGFGWGETETLLRKLLKEADSQSKVDSNTAQSRSRASKDRKPIVCTKFTPTPWRGDAKSVSKACKRSCERLGVDSVDLYQIHMPDIVQPLRFVYGDKPKDEIFWDGLAECYLSGIAKNVGVCNYGPTLLARAQEALAKRGVPLASNQIAFSLLNRGNGAQATLDAGKALGIKTLAYYPLAMGILTGKYSSRDPAENGGARSSLELRDLRMYGNGGKGGWSGSAVAEGGVRPLLSVMEGIAEAKKKTVSQVALNYVVTKGAIPIPGSRTTRQLADNMGAMGWRLSSNEVQALEKAADGLGFQFEGAGFKRTTEKFVGYGIEKWALD